MKTTDSPIFSSKKSALSYMAGVFDAKGKIYFNKKGKIGAYISGNQEYLKIIVQEMEKLYIDSAIQDSANPTLYFYGENAYIFLKSISDYLLFNKEEVEFALEHHMMLSMINKDYFNEWFTNQKNIFEEILNKLKNHDLEQIIEKDWFFNYSIGFFDSKCKIKINKRQNNEKTQYWLEIDLRSIHVEFLRLSSMKYGGHVISTRNLFKWSLFEEDANNFLENIVMYLIEKREVFSLAVSCSELINKVDLEPSQALKDKIEVLRIKIKKGKCYGNSNIKSFNIPLYVCKELHSKLDKLKVEMNISRSNLIRRAVNYYLEKYDEAEFHDYKICRNQPKKELIGFSADKQLFDKISYEMELLEITNRAEMIRNAIEFYCDTYNVNSGDKTSKEKNSIDAEGKIENPFDILDRLNKPIDDLYL